MPIIINETNNPFARKLRTRMVRCIRLWGVEIWQNWDPIRKAQIVTAVGIPTLVDRSPLQFNRRAARGSERKTCPPRACTLTQKSSRDLPLGASWPSSTLLPRDCNNSRQRQVARACELQSVRLIERASPTTTALRHHHLFAIPRQMDYFRLLE